MVIVRDGRVRDGDRQARRPLRRPCRAAQIDRGLLSGNRPRRARRRSGGRASVLGRGGFRQGAPADRRGRARTARRASARGCNALGALVETRGVPAADPARAFRRRAARELRQLRQLPQPARRAVDATEVARKFLSAVFRTGQSFGVGYIESVLTGQSSERSLMNGHEALPVFGDRVDGRGGGADQAGGARAAAARRAARQRFRRAGIRPRRAKAILKGEAEVDADRPAEARAAAARRAARGANPVGDPLFEALRAKRRELAQEAQVPPYVIFHDSVLRDMAATRPATLRRAGADHRRRRAQARRLWRRVPRGGARVRLRGVAQGHAAAKSSRDGAMVLASGHGSLCDPRIPSLPRTRRPG